MLYITKIYYIFIVVNLFWRLGCADQQQQQLVVSSNENDDDYLSQMENVLEKSYHGLIRENETLVEITPIIKVDEEKICNFRIIKKPYHEIPFQIELVNNLGILKARRTLNCEKRKSYHFEIVAIFCDGTHSTTANVHITVIDINEYAPVFLQPSYVTEVDEGRLYKEIIRVEASDKDCTPLFGDICKYEILNNDQPFTIDNEGTIKNVEPLSHKISHNHILSVVAYDCAMKESDPIMVSIKVRRVCEMKFMEIAECMDYPVQSRESLPLFPNARIELCDMYCDNQNFNIRTSVTLKTKHISFGCDRDNSNCATNASLIDLLPKDAPWTKILSYDEGGFETVFHFDGTVGAIIPNTVLPHHEISTRPFSIVTVFRHSQSAANDKHIKEHIICSADDVKMNRHHMALFVRNCRLILLLRENFNDGDLNIFSPAEWRWKIPHVCDNEWHHYVLNINQFSKVELYIDGLLFESSIEDRHSNPEVIDDWPLHAAHGVNTTLSIGACYQSSEGKLKHAFNGDISIIKVLLNDVLSSKDIKCATDCSENLVPPNEKYLESDTQIQINSQLNEIFIESQSKENIENLLQQIRYINTKKNPTIGRRNIQIRTTVMCVNQSVFQLPTVESYIMINDDYEMMITNENNSQKPYNNNHSPTMSAITADDIIANIDDNSNKGHQHQSSSLDLKRVDKIVIKGDTNHLVSYQEIKHGVHILNNINITISTNKRLSNIQTLDSCSVIVFPSLNPDHENIEIDGDETFLSSTLDLKTNINKDGVEIVGNDVVNNYVALLKSLVYSNKKPAYYLNRVFKLSCTQFNSHYKSAEFTLTLTVLHPKQSSIIKSTSAPQTPLLAYGNGFMSGSMSNTAQDNKLYSHSMIHNHDVQEPKTKIRSVIHKAESSHPTMLIILICVFLALLLCGVFIARIKNNNKYVDRHEPKIADESLVWDDSALTITINPMQTDTVSDDSSESENSDSDDEETLKGQFANANQLEWDNSNIFSATAN